MTRYTLTLPIQFTTRGGDTKTTYRRVGAVFENTRRDTSETLLSIRLDFPSGATELVTFPPRALGEEDDCVTD